MSIERHDYHRRHGEFVTAGAKDHYPPDLRIEPTHLDICLAVDVEQKTIEGTVTHRLAVRGAGTDELVLNGVGFEDVNVTGDEVDAFRYDGETITVHFARHLSAGSTPRVTVRYRAVDPASGLYFSAPCDDYPDAPRFAATDSETERARHWLPTIDQPSVRPTLRFELTAASDLTILANGVQGADTDNGDGTRTVVWTLDHPCPSYLTCFAIGEFVRFDDGDHEGRPLAYFGTAPRTPKDLERSFGRTGAMMAWMEKRLDLPFPYPKYFQFALPGYGGAMENISLVSWSDIFVLNEDLAREWTRFVDQVNLHEMAHSYFGDLVVCRDFANAWLKESWATYMEQVWFEEVHGDDEGDYEFLMNAEAYFWEADGSYVRPIETRHFEHSWQMYDRHLYPGGACRLHTLRKEVGDEVFWAAVADYLQTYANRTVETDDFRKKLEEHSGRSLVEWFEQWIRSKGYPQLKVGFAYDKKAAQGTFTIEQTQVDKDKAVGTFTFQIELGWVVDGTLHTRRVQIEDAKHQFVFSIPSDPEQVRVDPNTTALFKLDFNPGDDKLKKQLTDAGDVNGRIHAARELIKTARRANIRAVADAYPAESFWGVRKEMAKAFADSKTIAGFEALAEVLTAEEDGRVLWPVLMAAKSVRDAGVAGAIETRVRKGGLPPRALGAAYEVLGAQRDKAPIDLLRDAATTPSHQSIASGGAMHGLAASRDAGAGEVLRAATAWGARAHEARRAAALALGSYTASLREDERRPNVEALVDLLRDPAEIVHRGASVALGRTGAGSAIRALERYRATRAAQEQVDVDAVISRIRAAQKPAASAGSDELEELRKEMAKLKDRLDKIEAKDQANSSE